MAIKTFTTGEVLTAADTNTYLANGGLTYITSGTLSGTAIDGIFTSTYDNYRIVFTNCSLSTSALLNFNFRTTANATESGNDYYTAARRFDNGTNYDFSQGANTFGSTAINIATVAFGAFAMEIQQPRQTQRTTVSIVGNGVISQISTVQGSVFFNATTAFAGLIFSASAGTILGGSYTVYGYRKA